MNAEQVLLSFVGNHDPFSDGVEEPGPLLSLLSVRKFSHVYLFYTGPDYFERSRSVEEYAHETSPGLKFCFIDFELRSPIDYEEIYGKLCASISSIEKSIGHRNPEYSILLDPGTPQMQTAWFLLVRSETLNAHLLQGIPPQFAGGVYKVKEVTFENTVLPCLRRADTVAVQDVRWRSIHADDFIGGSPSIGSVFEKAVRAANYDISVLIEGETGTGKGFFAKLIHERSARNTKPFHAVNCAAVSAALVESELFGHAKGSFTGAERERLGVFRAADGGTVFLDEIGDLPLELQPKLLRALEEKKVQPLGFDNEVDVDVRVISATNKNLSGLVAEGKFRRDLYERLNHLTLHIPPLRERKEDIPIFLKHYVDEWNTLYRESKRIGSEVMPFLLDYPWPGNIRELQNAVTSMCASANSDELVPELLPPAVLAHFNRPTILAETSLAIPENGINLKAVLYTLEKRFYEEALRKTGGNKERAAELLGINAPAFRKAIRERFDDLAVY